MSAGVFITATGTDCGKTHVSCAALRELHRRGKPVTALKPLMSGFSPDALEKSDAGRLLAAMGKAVSPETVAEICWQSFTEWSAPNVAARKAGVDLDDREMLGFIAAHMAGSRGPVLVEGAGGVMSPLTDAMTNIDLMSELGLPVLMMTANYLGSVSHTLTALECLNRRSLKVAGVVVTQPWPNAGDPSPFVDELRRWTDARILVAPFSRTPDEDAQFAGPVADLLFGSA